jgi:hypothetical protein
MSSEGGGILLMESAPHEVPDMDVDQLAAEIAELATGQQLAIVPAAPVPRGCGGFLVLLDNDDLTAAQFCGLATAAGAKLLYMQTEYFDAETDLDTAVGQAYRNGHDDPAHSQLAEYRRDAAGFNGRARQLELAFAAGCVLHCWAVAADWYMVFLDRGARLLRSANHDH